MLDMGERNPVGRIVTPEDVAAAVTFLCSPDAEMIRGQTLIVDGGWSLLASLGASGSRAAEPPTADG
jgi:enoyl-[acyl-carrier protein] reductase III